MSSNSDTSSHIPVAGVLILVMLSFLWGANMVSIRFSNEGISPILAATIRSVVASFLLWVYAKYSSEKVFLQRGDLKHGIVIGVLFGVEFLLLYWGPSFTDVSRAVIFLYSHPFWVALGAHFLLTDDRLTVSKTAGLCLAFAGLVLVFGSRSPTLGPYFWVGDLLELTAGLLWAATTIYVKKFIWNRPISHFQTLFAQLFFSIPILAAGTLIFEWGRPIDLKTYRFGRAFLPVRHSSVHELPSLVLANSSISREPTRGFYFSDSSFWSPVERIDSGRSHNAFFWVLDWL